MIIAWEEHQKYCTGKLNTNVLWNYHPYWRNKYREELVIKRIIDKKRAPIVSSADRIYLIFFVQCVEIFGIAHINVTMIIGKNIKNTVWENWIQMFFKISESANNLLWVKAYPTHWVLTNLSLDFNPIVIIEGTKCPKRNTIQIDPRIYLIFFVQCVEIFYIAHINFILIIGKNIKNSAWEN